MTAEDIESFHQAWTKQVMRATNAERALVKQDEIVQQLSKEVEHWKGLFLEVKAAEKEAAKKE